MKKLCFITMIAVFILLFTNGLQAQTPQTQPNQVVIGSIETIYSESFPENSNKHN